ncbi:hypothetical protein B0T17DRAFT_599198 [Bombardia bombarda]|uniref:Zn(2)-C6 fungal-type domain-containing protein n=1 Tax=Bombardia bombarda TaxID=252184 RepID=A0AA40CAI6_9PEZI|nr:hypothetical protein B0T17DRAFT_599198 [Bombardia bombarda]
MQPSTRPSGRPHPRLHKSCTECRRRKQKCTIPAPGHSCPNCAKRWPPTECIFVHETNLSVKPGGVQVTSSRDFKHASLPHHRSQWSLFVLSEDEDKRPQTNNSSNDTALHSPITKSVGGILSAINCINSTRIENTARNTELMYFFLDYVAPNLVSIEGDYTPVLFRRDMLPWMLQSQLFPNIAILMASVVQILDRGGEADHSSEPLAIKVRVLSMINHALGRRDYDLSDVLRCIVNLVIIEWFWGSDDSMWAHLRGLKDLVNTRGGLQKLGDPLFAAVVTLVDFAVACCFETKLCVQDWKQAMSSAPPFCPPLLKDNFTLISPLLPSSRSFMQLRDTLAISSKAARILNGVLSLTLAITSPATSTVRGHSKDLPIIQAATALDQLLVLSLSGEGNIEEEGEGALLNSTIRLAARIYTKAILYRQPISHPRIKDETLSQQLYTNIKLVGARRWKLIPGIFLWVLLVATPHPNNNNNYSSPGKKASISQEERDRRIKYLRRKMATGAQAVGQEDFGLAIAYLRAFCYPAIGYQYQSPSFSSFRTMCNSAKKYCNIQCLLNSTDFRLTASTPALAAPLRAVRRPEIQGLWSFSEMATLSWAHSV